MYNLRYHIASLVSVFLALALGLVLGGLAVGGGMIDRQQGALVKGLQDEFSKLRDENRALSAENKMLSSFSGDVISEWSARRLEKHTVVVLTSPGLENAVEATKRSVERAGGTVAVLTMTAPRMGLGDAERSGVASLVPDPAAAEDSLAEVLATEWRSGGRLRPTTAALVEEGVLKVQGLPEDPGEVCFVLLAGEEGKADALGAAVLRSFAKLGPAVGAEMPDLPTGAAKAAANSDLAAMDTLGSVVGDYTLVSVLMSQSKGYYGTATGAKEPYPAISLR